MFFFLNYYDKDIDEGDKEKMNRGNVLVEWIRSDILRLGFRLGLNWVKFKFESNFHSNSILTLSYFSKIGFHI